jgi:hypothetical protein
MIRAAQAGSAAQGNTNTRICERTCQSLQLKHVKGLTAEPYTARRPWEDVCSIILRSPLIWKQEKSSCLLAINTNNMATTATSLCEGWKQKAEVNLNTAELG